MKKPQLRLTTEVLGKYMNAPILSQNDQKTISSRELAALCDKRHDHICRDIVNLNSTYEGMGFPKVGEGYYTHPSTGSQQHREFLLTKEQSIDLITGYRADLRIKINRRWAELEEQSRSTAFVLPDFTDPAEAAMAWAQEYKAKQAAHKQLELQAPKVAFVERYVEGKGNKTFREVAKLLRIKENVLRNFLTENKIMYKLNGEWTAYNPHVDAKRFYTVTGTAETGHSYNRALFTPKGIEWLAGEIAKADVRNGGVA